jgi:hypothetical protein
MFFNDLPSEIILDILDQFNDDTEDRKALQALSLSSCRLHTLTTPVLYHSPFSLDDYGRYSTASNRLPLLLRSLLRNPALTKLVATMSLICVEDMTPMEGIQIQFKNDMDVLADEDWVLVADAIEELYATNPSNNSAVGRINDVDTGIFDKIWYEEVGQGKWAAVSAIILSLLPNMKYLAVYGWGTVEVSNEEGNHLRQFIKKAAQSEEIENRETEEELQLGAPSNSWFVETKAALRPKFRTLDVYYYDMLESVASIYLVPPFILPPSVEVVNIHDQKIGCDCWDYFLSYNNHPLRHV